MTQPKPIVMWMAIYIVGSMWIMFVGQVTDDFAFSMGVLVAWIVTISLIVLRGRWRCDA